MDDLPGISGQQTPEPDFESRDHSPAEPPPASDVPPSSTPGATGTSGEPAGPAHRSYRRQLLLLLSLGLTAFLLTAWILVRVESPEGLFANGPSEVARAQLRALGRGDLEGAYAMFSERYRKQVSFDAWHELVVTHWRMFHAEVIDDGAPTRSGREVTVEIHLRGINDREYLARFTLTEQDGRWWVDDLHWDEMPDERDIRRT
jgi:Domain of unknown function (DUF4864)